VGGGRWLASPRRGTSAGVFTFGVKFPETPYQSKRKSAPCPLFEETLRTRVVERDEGEEQRRGKERDGQNRGRTKDVVEGVPITSPLGRPVLWLSQEPGQPGRHVS